MAPLVRRMHLFEIDDQTWFPSFLRARVQSALTEAWTFHFPGQPCPAHLAAEVLTKELGPSVRDFVFIDFCAGGGGPTPHIERRLNRQLAAAAETATAKTATAKTGGSSSNDSSSSSSSAEVEADPRRRPRVSDQDAVQFVLTDLFPHVDNWTQAAARSPNVHYEPEPVDASRAPAELLARYKRESKGIFRLFNLAFHHFDDPLARAILRNTVETSDGFAIFELQDRSFNAFLTCCLLGIGFLLAAPYFAFKWPSHAAPTLFFTYLLPILPFVLVFDGWMSSLRTRTPEEVEAMLRTCGAPGADDTGRWEVRSGRVCHLWPCGYLNWIVCVKKK